jgi:acetyl esterase/lipase
LADISKTTVYVPDYRLGPENKYPAQLDDGVSTYISLINDFGYSPNQIAIGGDSAGGNLALITLLKLKKLGVDLPSSLALLCPPIMIQVGTEELLLSDSQTLKKLLERDGCEHEYFEWEGMYHVFHIDVKMPETIQAFKQIGSFLEKHLPKK